jgi:hypothetical protein
MTYEEKKNTSLLQSLNRIFFIAEGAAVSKLVIFLNFHYISNRKQVEAGAASFSIHRGGAALKRSCSATLFYPNVMTFPM